MIIDVILIILLLLLEILLKGRRLHINHGILGKINLSAYSQQTQDSWAETDSQSIFKQWL